MGKLKRREYLGNSKRGRECKTGNIFKDVILDSYLSRDIYTSPGYVINLKVKLWSKVLN